MEFSSMISVAAMLIALLSAYFAWRSSAEAKRTADKTLGDLLPFFDVFQDESTIYDGHVPRLNVTITNHNRRAVLISLIEIDTNDGYVAYSVLPPGAEDDGGRSDIASIIEAYGDQAGRFSSAPPIRIPGNAHLGPASTYRLFFNVTKNHDVLPSSTTVGVKVEYSLEGEPAVDPFQKVVEIHRWIEDDYNTKLRLKPALDVPYMPAVRREPRAPAGRR